MQRVDDLLRSRPTHGHQCQGMSRCNDVVCQSNTQSEYNTLISCLKDADKGLPRHKSGVEKDLWTI